MPRDQHFDLFCQGSKRDESIVQLHDAAVCGLQQGAGDGHDGEFSCLLWLRFCIDGDSTQQRRGILCAHLGDNFFLRRADCTVARHDNDQARLPITRKTRSSLQFFSLVNSSQLPCQYKK